MNPTRRLPLYPRALAGLTLSVFLLSAGCPPALLAQPDSLRPKELGERRTGLEELIRHLEPTPPSAAGLEEVQARAEEFVQVLVPEGKPGLIPVVIGAGLEEQHPELRALGRLRGLPILFARRMTPPEVAVELITRWDAREAVLAGLEEEVARYQPIIEEAGIAVRKVTPANAGQLLLAILAPAAGMEEAALAALKDVGRFLDDLDALGRRA